ncbi:MAG: hypothetical protein IPI73_13980 [Betaproteobacteria bacterium]|nr:hypothetical protein [Betaproteobacteria bacterium]
MALNFAIFAGGFSLQWGLGAIADAMVATGATRGEAYQRAFGLLAAALLVTLCRYGIALMDARSPAPPGGTGQR